MKILVIGGGNMGLTYAQSFLNSHIVTHENMLILEKSMSKAEGLKKLNIGTVYGEPGDYVEKADLIILAVKPQDCDDLFKKIKGYINEQQVVISIMAGVEMSTIAESIGTKKIIRAMPNLPAQIGVGMTVFTSSHEVTRIELVTVQNLLNATGKTIYVEDENMINAATAISGSGPAYIFYFMQSMIESALSMGFNQSEAELLAYQTFKGSVESFKKFDYTCDEWIQRVSSRGGTTEAALNSFNNNTINENLKKGYQAALDRAIQLSNK